MRHGDIKDPTVRKVRNRGFTPVVYHQHNTHVCRQVSGWIIKEARKYLYFNSPTTGRLRLLKTERQHMREIH